ncbi:MAG: 6-phosphogluconolactonase [Pirellulales bacterium]|nr:6-phosphogluconolactonase [Pirellulales bacterium]
MRINIFEDKSQMGVAAAGDGAERIRSAISKRGAANIILATGASQFEMLEALASRSDIEWPRVTAFHLD